MSGQTGANTTRRALAVLVLAAALAVPVAAPVAAKEDPRAEIRAARAAFNRAIMAGDMAGIEAALADNAQTMRGTGSEVVSGKPAQLAFWRQTRLGSAPAQYQRTPTHIELSRVAPMALETGTWRGGPLATPEDWARGRYVAKWRRIDGRWRIESETYMTVACGGTMCPK